MLRVCRKNIHIHFQLLRLNYVIKNSFSTPKLTWKTIYESKLINSSFKSAKSMVEIDDNDSFCIPQEAVEFDPIIEVTDNEVYLMTKLSKEHLIHNPHLFFDPTMIKNLKEIPYTSNFTNPNKYTKQILLETEKLLQHFNKYRSLVLLKNHFRCKFPTIRNKLGKIALTTMTKVRDDNELKVLIACLSIICPSKNQILDQFESLTQEMSSKQSIDIALLSISCLHSIAKVHRLNDLQMKSSKLLLSRLKDDYDAKSKKIPEVNKNQLNIFHHDPPIHLANDIFAPIGGGIQTRDSVVIDRIGLQLTLLLYGLNQMERTTHNTIFEHFSKYFLQCFSTIHAPIHLICLQKIWECTPLLKIPQAHSIYKALYEQILYSITTESHQIYGQEELICSLLESMVKSQFKNSNLISLIGQTLLNRGFNLEYIMQIYNHLIQLDHIELGTEIFQKLMNLSKERVAQFYSNSKGWRSRLSPEATEKIYLQLNQPQVIVNMGLSTDPQLITNVKSYRSIDLMIALFCFNHELQSSPRYLLMEGIELSIIPLIPQLPLREVLALLCFYGQTGRYYAPIIEPLNQIISNHITKLNSHQLSTILWYNARLNNRHCPYNKIAANLFVNLMGKDVKSIQYRSYVSLFLWSLSVLEILTIEIFLKMEPLLRKQLEPHKYYHEVEGNTHNQLSQVRCELYFVLERDLPVTELWTVDHEGMLHEKKSTINSNSTVREQLRRCINFMNGILKANLQKIRNKYLMKDKKEESLFTHSETNPMIMSSYTHQDLSNVLSFMGIEHVNEKRLENGYVVDIFISNDSMIQFQNRMMAMGANVPPPPLQNIEINGEEKMNQEVEQRFKAEEICYDDEDAFLGVNSNLFHFTNMVRDRSGEGNDQVTCGKLGVIIEFDGPYHFETYLQQKIGKTSMKHRHLERSGYTVLPVPYWKYSKTFPMDKKVKILNEMFQKIKFANGNK